MKIKVKKLHLDAKMPTQGTALAAGFDLYATETITVWSGVPTMIPTGLAFEIPKGFCGVIYSRSSSTKKGLVIVPLIVDSDYRGEVFVLANRLSSEIRSYIISKGDRIAQMRIEKLEPTEFEWANKLSETERSAGGVGSTGR